VDEKKEGRKERKKNATSKRENSLPKAGSPKGLLFVYPTLLVAGFTF
jgi:hypothetical protein